MKESILNEEFMNEDSFWHITNRQNVESIKKHGLIPHDGKRGGKLKSAEDPVPRCFFSYGLEGVLEQANNLAFLINIWIKSIAKTSDGENGKNIKEKIQKFLDNGLNDENEKNETNNVGFIDLSNYIKENIFKNGIDESLTEQDIDMIIYNIAKTIWENNICLKANLREGVDFSWKDYNYNSKGTQKIAMTKRNMHTFEGRIIETDLLEIIVDENGKSRTTWDVFKEMAMFYKTEHPDKKWLPVEEWQSGYEDENGHIIYTGKVNHRKDYLSLFMKFEEMEQLYSSKLVQSTENNTLLDEIGPMLLKNSIEATEASTRTGIMNDKVIEIRKKIEQERTQENSLDKNDDNDNRK